jgi:hypothetical protein
MAAPLVLALLAGVAAVEESIAFIFFIEEESIQVIQMAIFQCLRYNQKTEAKRLLNELEHHYLKMMYDDLNTVWGGGLGFDVGGIHFSAFYGHDVFTMFADAVFEQVQAYKKIL